MKRTDEQAQTQCSHGTPLPCLPPRRPLRLPALYDDVVPLYFISFNTHHRQPVLARPEVHDAFVDFCRKAEGFRVRVGGYVLMPDHVHLLVMMPEKTRQALNAWIKSLKSVLGKRLLVLGFEKPHWQEGFFDHVLRSDESYCDKRRYILQNPVRADLCQSAEGWPYQGEIVAL